MTSRDPMPVRLYRALLGALPRAFRDEHGDAMLAVFEEQLAESHAHGPYETATTCFSATTDLVRGAIYEHWRRRGRRAPRRRPVSFFFADVRFALRTFRRQPASTALLVFTLALAVAANTVIFALVDGVFFRPFPYSHPNQLVYLNETAPRWNLDFTGINYPDFVSWRDRTRTFQAMAEWQDETVILDGAQTAERVPAASTTYDLPAVLGIHPVAGRFFTADEDKPNAPHVVLLSYALWKSRFAGRADAVGGDIRINSAPYQVVGVLPPEADIPFRAKVWVPLGADPNSQDQNYGGDGIGRLRPGVTVAQAAKDLDFAQEPIWAKRDTSHVVSPRVLPLRDRFVADFRAVGIALGAAVALVLLIACANVAGAMLARAVFRRREIGIRLALGANAGRIVRQLLTESLVIASAGGIVGALVGTWGVKLLIAANPEFIPPWAALDPGPRTIVFAIAIVAITSVLFGLLPALRARGEELRDSLSAAATRATTSRNDRRMLNALVVTEIALAVVLLVGGGLLARAYGSLRTVDPGFRSSGLTFFRVTLPAGRYKPGRAQMKFYETFMTRIRTMPGVDHVGVVTCPPFGCHWGTFYRVEGAAPLAKNQQDPVVLLRYASPDYFKAMDIRLVKGRVYAENEGHANADPRPAVINEELAHQFWPNGEDPIGRRFRPNGDTSSNWSTVIGVVHDVKHYGLQRKMIGGLYLPLTRIDSTQDMDSFAFAVHSTGDPASVFAPIRTALRQLDPEVPLVQLQSGAQAIQRALAPARTIALVLSAFAVIALILALGGVYAVLSYVVGRRRHEIGIRVALGARRNQVLGLVVRQGMTLVAIGLLLGVPAALLASRALASLLVGVSASDPLTYAAVVVVLGATAAVAAWIPARRAATVDPTAVLKDG